MSDDWDEHKSCPHEHKLPEIADGKFDRTDMRQAIVLGFVLGMIAGFFLGVCGLELLYGIG